METLSRYSFQEYVHGKSQPAATRQQFPIKLAYALTVHRAQGQTIKNLVVDCSNFFAAGHVGVAVGRAVDKQGLQVLNYSQALGAIRHSVDVYNFYESSYNVPAMANMECCSVSHAADADNTLGDDGDTLGNDGDTLDAGNTLGDDGDTLGDDGNTLGDGGNTLGDDGNTLVDGDNTLGDSHRDDSHRDDGDSHRDEAVDTRRDACFPWDPTVLLGQLGYTLEELKIDPSTLDTFLKRVYTKVKDCYDKKHSKQVDMYTALNKYALGDDLLEAMLDLFGTTQDNLTESQNVMCTQIMTECMDRLVNKTADTRVAEQKKKAEAAVTRLKPDDIHGPIRGKIRFILGSCLKAVKDGVQRALTSKLHMASAAAKNERAVLYRQQRLMSSLRVMEATIITTTEDPESLQEINLKQGHTHGLTHVYDQVFRFFLALYGTVQPYHAGDFMHLYQSEMLNFSRSVLFSDEELLLSWLALFPVDVDTCGSGDIIMELEADLVLSLKINMYEMAVDHFLKRSLAENLFNFKKTIPRKKKQALRPMLQSMQAGSRGKKVQKDPKPQAGSRRKKAHPDPQLQASSSGKKKAHPDPEWLAGSRRKSRAQPDPQLQASSSGKKKVHPDPEWQAGSRRKSRAQPDPELQAHSRRKRRAQPDPESEPEPDADQESEPELEDVEPCGQCAQPCEWEPADQTKQSLQCTSCIKWFHYGCVQVNGSEAFLRRANAKWLCPHCDTGKNKGRGKRSKK